MEYSLSQHLLIIRSITFAIIERSDPKRLIISKDDNHTKTYKLKVIKIIKMFIVIVRSKE